MSSQALTFTVLYRPAPQGSKRAFVNRYTGKVALKEQSQALPGWRAAVTAAAVAATRGWESAEDEGRQWAPITGPVTLEVVVRFARPQHHYGVGRNLAVLRPAAPRAPITRNHGDIDKHARAVCDALTDAGVWGDDSQVARLIAAKAWADPGQGFLPGATINVWPWGEDDA